MSVYPGAMNTHFSIPFLMSYALKTGSFQPSSLWQPRRVGCVGDGREAQEGGGHISVYLWLIHVDAWQKPAQYCKAIIFLLKKKHRQFFFFHHWLWDRRKRGRIFLFNNFIFIFGSAGSSLLWGLLSSCGRRGPSVVVLRSHWCGAQALGVQASVVLAPRLWSTGQ